MRESRRSRAQSCVPIGSGGGSGLGWQLTQPLPSPVREQPQRRAADVGDPGPGPKAEAPPAVAPALGTFSGGRLLLRCSTHTIFQEGQPLMRVSRTRACGPTGGVRGTRHEGSPQARSAVRTCAERASGPPHTQPSEPRSCRSRGPPRSTGACPTVGTGLLEVKGDPLWAD